MMKISSATLLLSSLALVLRSGQSEVACEGGRIYQKCETDTGPVCYPKDEKDEENCAQFVIKEDSVVYDPSGVDRMGDGAPNKIEIGAGFDSPGGNSGVVIGGTDTQPLPDPAEVITHDPIPGAVVDGVDTNSDINPSGFLDRFVPHRRQLRWRTSLQQGEQQR